MTDWLLSLVPTYGLWLVAFVTFGSCIALPIPASVIMMAAGAFAASGDFSVIQLILAALAGAVLGDHCGYLAGRYFGSGLIDGLARKPARGKMITKAQNAMAARGRSAIFLSRWLFSPLGPYINILAGALRAHWLPFAIFGFAGEAVWVSLYILLGNQFADNLDTASDMIASILGLIGALAVLVGLGLWLRHLKQRQTKAKARLRIWRRRRGLPEEAE